MGSSPTDPNKPLVFCSIFSLTVELRTHARSLAVFFYHLERLWVTLRATFFAMCARCYQ